MFHKKELPETTTETTTGNLIEIICQFAKDKNEKGLIALLESGISLNPSQDNCNSVMLLAMHGDNEAVEFLMTKFSASRNCAAQGYARGRHIKQVNELIAQGANLGHAVHGYAWGGHVEQVNELIEKEGANLIHVVHGYAEGGRVEQVNELIEKEGANINHAVHGYAKGGHVGQVNELIEKGASLKWAVVGYAEGGHVEQVNDLIEKGVSLKLAAQGYAIGGHVKQVNKCVRVYTRSHIVLGYEAAGYLIKKNILSLMAHTDDDTLRVLLASKAKEKDDTLDAAELTKKAKRLNKIMREYKLNYVQANALSIKGTTAWLLQGLQLTSNQGGLIEDIFFKISSLVLGLSIPSTKTVFEAVHNRLFTMLTQVTLYNFNLKIFDPQQYNEISQRCDQRKNIGYSPDCTDSAESSQQGFFTPKRKLIAGLSVISSLLGAAGCAVVGALIGAPFFGVGAIIGGVIGGVIGLIGGAIAGSVGGMIGTQVAEAECLSACYSENKNEITSTTGNLFKENKSFIPLPTSEESNLKATKLQAEFLDSQKQERSHTSQNQASYDTSVSYTS